MLTLATGKKILPVPRSREMWDYSNKAFQRLSTDVFFWNLFQVHWLHSLHQTRLGPDLGGQALYGYIPCSLQQAASNLMVYAGYKFLRVSLKGDKTVALTEGLLEFTGNHLSILPGGRPGLWAGEDFNDFSSLALIHGLSPEGVYALFTRTLEEQ